jgi:leader peptidase (prepilin peptidase)/N-methyltransferase
MSYFTGIVAALFGMMTGSFLNVVIYRLPEGRSIVRPRSACRGCKEHIRWFDNIPVISYLLLKGRCRSCGERISPRYPIVELLAGLLAFAVVRYYGYGINAVFVYSFLMALLAVTLIDWDHRIIPDQISISFIAIGLCWSYFSPDLTLFSSLAGAVAGGGSLWLVGIIYKKVRHTDGMGGGDVKLMAMIGAFLGIELVLPVILLASLLGSLYGVTLLRQGGKATTAVAFGSFLAPAAAFCMFFGSSILSWYLTHF